jgi:hypothetical protein
MIFDDEECAVLIRDNRLAGCAIRSDALLDLGGSAVAELYPDHLRRRAERETHL